MIPQNGRTDDRKVDIQLQVDWRALQPDASSVNLTAPAIQDFQPARVWKPADTITVEPCRDYLI